MVSCGKLPKSYVRFAGKIRGKIRDLGMLGKWQICKEALGSDLVLNTFSIRCSITHAITASKTV